MPLSRSERQLICILDDDTSVLWSTGNLLASLGFKVQSFPSAEAFLEAGPPAPDCLICDVQMPGLSGMDLFEILCTRGFRIPMIFVTAFSPTRLREVTGPDVAVLGKPFRSEDLLDALRSVLKPKA
ncbi:response regulator [bacterium]|nr:response regulator [bacterium]